MVLEDRKDGSSLPRPSGSFSKSSPSEMDVVDQYNRKSSPESSLGAEKVEKKPGGWRAVSFILGNETLERLGSIGLLANFMVYLTKVFHLEQVDAANVINIWSGFTNLTPLVGAYISDTYVGRFKTIAFASFATLLNMNSSASIQIKRGLLKEFRKSMDNEKGTISSDLTTRQRKPLGWKAMPYIIGNETLERLATFGLMANFMVYMVREYHMDQVQAATLINTWSALTNFAPIIGAFISDSYAGKFNTIVFGSTAELLGMLMLTFTSLIPNLRPPPCTADQITGKCIRYSNSQLYVLLSGLFLLSVGTGGIRSCSVPFSLDQFDDSTEEGREGSRSFFSWYYTTHTIVQLVSMTLVLYVQNNISWAIGFAIPTVLNLFALLLLFVGTRFYVFVKPEGSVFSGIFKVLVAAYKKRNVRFPSGIDYYRPLLETDLQSNKLVLTDQFRFLNKAVIVMNNDEAGNEEWRICTVRRIEDMKSIISIIPIFASSIIGFLAMNQQQTFTVSQALKMDLQFPGTSYLIPPASITVISLLTIGIWLPFYETVLVRHIENITKQEGGISLLQKVGIGNIFSILTMFISGIVERKRRDLSLTGVNMSVFWLTPQQVLMGFYQVFTIVGLTEFFNKQVPINMRSIGNSLLYLGLSLASYLSSAMVSIVHSVTARGGRQSWLTDDIDTSKLDYFYYFIAALSTLNLIFFFWCARRYRYRNYSDEQR